MTEKAPVSLEKLGDSELMLADSRQDVRGRKLVDSAGTELGKVDGLFIDTQERRVRLLEVTDGGLLGFGGTTRLVPAEAVVAIDEEHVTVAADPRMISGSPAYDPDLKDRPDYFDEFYGYYGIGPFWASGYRPMGPFG